MAKTTKTTSKKTVTKKATKGKAKGAAKKGAKSGVGAFVFGLIAKGATNRAIQEAVAAQFPGSALVQNPSAHIGWYRTKYNKGVTAKERKPAAKVAKAA